MERGDRREGKRGWRGEERGYLERDEWIVLR
jgi:hypothetical protein